MNILVANLGSTSFKFRLFDMTTEELVARGGVERIGAAQSPGFVEFAGQRRDSLAPLPDHAVAVRRTLDELSSGQGAPLAGRKLAAIGFKAVHGGRFEGVERVVPEVLAEMERMAGAAPAHNPPYVAAMRLLAERLPEIPLVAAFETDFHRTIPARNRQYAVPRAWAERYGLRRCGFHGASHRFIAERAAQLLARGDLRIVSCHLGGSSSLCAIRDGRSVANSFGFSPQSGLPHNNRVGQFDPFALPLLMRELGASLDDVLGRLASGCGLAGLSGTSGDLRDVEAAADAGSADARLALDLFVAEVRNALGAYLVELRGADLIAFTGGIGENSARLRAAVCADLEWAGIEVDPAANESARGEARVSASSRRTQIWTIPANEELIVARRTKALLEGS